MDRSIVHPGAIPLVEDFLYAQRSTLAAFGALGRATLGTAPVADGLACVPTVPASLAVVVEPGSITGFGPLDTTAYGVLPADSSGVVRLGQNLAPVTFPLAAPTTSGRAINYLIQATFSESDASPVVLPYYNAANPAQPYSGPDNSGVAQNTRRLQRVQLQVKPGASANTGTQTTPAVDAGWVGLHVVTVSFGQTAITASHISTAAGAPILGLRVPHIAGILDLLNGYKAATDPRIASLDTTTLALLTQLNAVGGRVGVLETKTNGRLLAFGVYGGPSVIGHNLNAATARVRIRQLGSGGAGGGAHSTAAGVASVGSGGGSGGESLGEYNKPSLPTTQLVITNGGGGNPVAGAAGGTGAASSVSCGPTQLLFTYGGLGGGTINATTQGCGENGAGAPQGNGFTGYGGGPIRTGGGTAGGSGTILAANIAMGGQGAGTPGGGGNASGANSVGAPAKDWGAGGGGACNLASQPDRAGGAGFAALTIIEEYSA